MTPRESELKLAFAPGRLERVRATSMLPRLGPGQVLHAVYFDTKGRALAGAGFTLRVRAEAGRFVQTLKTRAAPGGVMGVRGEWSWEVPGLAPEPTWLAATPAGLAWDGAPLMQVFETRVVRESGVATPKPGSRVMVALDYGEITAATGRWPIAELELELAAGSEAALLDLAASLCAERDLRLEPESKPDRGWRLALGEMPAPRALVMPTLSPGISVADGLAEMLRAGLGLLVGNWAAARVGVPEGVHQMRVATRWLRASLALFGPLLDGTTTAPLMAGLRDLGRALGVARDWDVFCGVSVAAGLAAAEHEAVRAALLATAETRRGAARAAVAARLEAGATTRLALHLARLAEAPGLMRGRLEDLAPELLSRRFRKFLRAASDLPDLTPTLRHEARKALKKFIYGASFVAGLGLPGVPRNFLRDCRRLQHALGVANDRTRASALAMDLAGEAGPGAHLLAAWARADEAAVMARITDDWKRVRRQGKPLKRLLSS